MQGLNEAARAEQARADERAAQLRRSREEGERQQEATELADHMAGLGLGAHTPEPGTTHGGGVFATCAHCGQPIAWGSDATDPAQVTAWRARPYGQGSDVCGAVA